MLCSAETFRFRRRTRQTSWDLTQETELFVCSSHLVLCQEQRGLRMGANSVGAVRLGETSLPRELGLGGGIGYVYREKDLAYVRERMDVAT
jgi:hypothetical protein